MREDGGKEENTKKLNLRRDKEKMEFVQEKEEEKRKNNREK